MVQLGGGLGLALEAVTGALVLAELAGDDLDRDLAAEHGIESPEDLAHGALAELVDDLELADLAELHAPPKSYHSGALAGPAKARPPSCRGPGNWSKLAS